MVSYRAFPLPTGTGIAINFLLTILVEHTVVVGLLEGVVHARIIVIAGANAVFEVLNVKGINKDAFTLECPMAYTRRTPKYRKSVGKSQDIE